ncbi:MAG TPA: hypothetical protein VFI02_18705 [Armatimonadota bacterium]|nr:hypothetical protein [Armatimonadota bacterium]
MKLPTQDDALNLVGILRHHLPKDFPALDAALSAEEQRQLDTAKDKLLTELVLGQNGETRKAVFVASVPVIEGFISGYRARSAMGWLGIAFMIYIIVDKALFAQHDGFTRQSSREEYFTYASPRLRFSASELSNLYKEGSTFEDKKFLLLGGTGGIPGLTLDFVAQNRTKLLDLTEAVVRHDQRQALLHFRDDSSREFAQWAKYTAPTSSSAQDATTPEETAEEKAKTEARKAAAKARAAERRKTIAARQAEIDAEVAELSDEEKFVIRTFQSRMVPFIAEAPQGRAEFLDELPSRLVSYRESLEREVDARTPRRAFDPNDSVNFADGLGKVTSVFEAEERITAAVTSLAEHKRAVCILAYRLHNEPALIQQWQALGYHNLQDYAEARLGIGPEIYKYAKTGRALIRYHYLIADLPDHDSEGFFRQMEHVERAIQTHKGDSLAVEHALITLTPEDFKEFARNPDFVERKFSHPVTQAQLDQVYEFRSSMRHLRAHGSVLRLVALRDRDESRYVYRVFEQMEAELAAQAAIALADKPAMDASALSRADIIIETAEYASAV